MQLIRLIAFDIRPLRGMIDTFMLDSKIDSDFLRYLLDHGIKPGDRLPSFNELSEDLGVGIGKLREQFEVARTLGLVDAKPRRGITRTEYDFLPPVRLSLLAAIAIDRSHFDAFSGLRAHLEAAYWDEAVALLTDGDKQRLNELVAVAKSKLTQARIQIPHVEHRQLHLMIFCRLNNPFVSGLLEAYWDAYEAVELNTYADLAYLQNVWHYHDRIVEAICSASYTEGKKLLLEHMNLLNKQGISTETRLPELVFAK